MKRKEFNAEDCRDADDAERGGVSAIVEVAWVDQ